MQLSGEDEGEAGEGSGTELREQMTQIQTDLGEVLADLNYYGSSESASAEAESAAPS